MRWPWSKIELDPKPDKRTEVVVERLESIADRLGDALILLEGRLREEGGNIDR